MHQCRRHLTHCVVIAAFAAAVPIAAGQTVLDPAGRYSAACTGLTSPGWDAKSFPIPTQFNSGNFGLERAKQGARYMTAVGYSYGEASGIPNINYDDVDCAGVFSGSRDFPGFPAGTDRDDFGMLAKGWICFPQAGTYTLHVNSDDGYEVVLGAGKTNQVVSALDVGRGCDANDLRSRWDLVVSAEAVGVYPIQVLQYDGGGGAGIEFYRLVGGTPYLIGAPVDGTPADQPTVYGLLDGATAPDVIETWTLPWSAGTAVTLPTDGWTANCGDAALTEPGWDVSVFPIPPSDLFGPGNSLARTRAAIAFNNTFGILYGNELGVETLNYEDTGCEGIFKPSNSFVNMLQYVDNNDFGMMAKGWICFPAAGTYVLHVDSDDGFEVIIGTGAGTPATWQIDTGHGCGAGDFAGRAEVNVSQPGVYPIQMLWFEGNGGAGFEFYRLTPPESPVGFAFELVGAAGSLPDQPTVFSLYNGQRAPDLSATYTGPGLDPGSIAATVPAALRTTDSPSGLTQPGWEVRTYQVPVAYGDYGLSRVKPAIRFNESLGNRIATATGEPDLNYWNFDCKGIFQPSRAFPGIPLTTGTDDFGILAKGWVYFPRSGDYLMQVDVDDAFELTIGTASNFVVLNSLSPPGDTGHGCNMTDLAQRFTVTVESAGVYPIQLITAEGWGGAGVEFYRWVQPQNGEPGAVKLIGASDGGLADQPLVFGLLNGQPAPDLISTYPIPTSIELLASERVAGTGTGDQVFNIKVVQRSGAGGGMFPASGGWGSGVARNFMRFLNDIGGGSQAQVINFRGVNDDGSIQPDGRIADGVNYPAAPNAQFDNFGLLITGFAVFPSAGQYSLLINSDDDVYVKFGNQTVFSGAGVRDSTFILNVTAAGTYPVQIEHADGCCDARIEFGQNVTGVGLVPVNSAQSTIKVYEAATSGSFETSWPSYRWVVPAAAVVADVNAGGIVGFNTLLVTAPLAEDGFTVAYQMRRTGETTFLAEDELGGVTGVSGLRAPSTTQYLNFSDHEANGATGQNGSFNANQTGTGQQIADLDFGVLDSTGSFIVPSRNPDDFAMIATGYVLFPTAGYYAFTIASDDGAMIWLGGQPVNAFAEGRGTDNTTPSFVWVEEPGLYDLRIEYLERNGGCSMEFFQYLPDGSVALINGPGSLATMKVYRTLADGVDPETTAYAKPYILPDNARVAAIDDGDTPGFHVQIGNAVWPLGGDENGGLDRETFGYLKDARDLVDSLFRDGLDINHEGVVAADTVVGQIAFANAAEYPGPPNGDRFATRVTGAMALTAGSHLFEIKSDDGFEMYMGGADPRIDGTMVGRTHDTKGYATDGLDSLVYVVVPADGLYSFEIIVLERAGGEGLYFNEVFVDPANKGILTAEAVNVGERAAKVYATYTPCSKPFADADGDGDVDQADFAAFQACFSGPGVLLTGTNCACFDVDNQVGDSDIDAEDLAAFNNCITGPDILWTQSATPNCNP